jgi:hypothetical protein
MKPFDDLQPGEAKQETKREKNVRAVEFVRSFMLKSREYRQPHLELAQQARELYQCWLREGRSPINRANLKLPYAFSLVQEQIPKVVEAVLSERPIGLVEGNEIQDVQWEDGINDFLDIQIEAMRFPVKLIEYVTGLLLDGTAFAKVPYRYEERVVRRRSFDDQNEMVFDEDLKVAYDGADMIPISFHDFYPDWTSQRPGDIQGMRGMAHRFHKSLSELKANPRYQNLDELETSVRIKGVGGDRAWSAPYWSEEAQSRYDSSRDNKPGVKIADQIELWEYWGIFDTTGKGDWAEYVVTVANGDVAIRCEENPFDYQQRPFVASPNYVRDNEFYGIPEIVVIRSLIKEGQALRNARLDQVSLAIYRMYVVDRSAGIKARSLFSRPNGIIWANDVQGIRELNPPEVAASAFRELQELQAEMKETLGMMSGAPGVNSLQRNAARSATGVQFVNNIQASRVSLKVRILAETLVKPMTLLQLQYADQFVTDEQWVRVSDPEKAAQNPFTVLPKGVFSRALDFKIKTPFETGGKQAEIEKLQMLGQYAQTAEATQPGTIKWDVFFENVGRDLLGSKYKKFVRTEQERMAMQQQQMAQEQAVNSMQGQRAPQPNAGPSAPPSGGPQQ